MITYGPTHAAAGAAATTELLTTADLPAAQPNLLLVRAVPKLNRVPELRSRQVQIRLKQLLLLHELPERQVPKLNRAELLHLLPGRQDLFERRDVKVRLLHSLRNWRVRLHGQRRMRCVRARHVPARDISA